MKNSAITKLIEALSRQTDTGKIHWAPTNQENTFQVDFANGSIRFSEIANINKPNFEYIICIYNRNGDLVDQYSDADLSGENPGAFASMQEIFKKARRNAYKSDIEIKNILDELNE